MSDDKIVDLRKLVEERTKVSLVFSSDDPYLEQMNKNHAFIHSVGGKPMVSSYVYNVAFETEILEFITPTSLEVRYSNQTANKIDKNGKETPIPLGKWWLEHANRREYNTVIFDPSKPSEYNNCLNLWEGFKVAPEKGCWKFMLRHIYTILCNRSPDKFKYVVKWLAWCVQNPGIKADVAICFKGLQGSGKGILLSQFVKIFGRHAMHISNREHLTGKFNGHLGLCSFLFADEAYYPGDKQVEGVLRQLITEEKIPIEGKGLPVIVSKNSLHIAMATNNDWVIPMTSDDRRFFVNKVEDTYAKGQINDTHRNLYFSNIALEMDRGGRAAMLHDLLNMSLDDWAPYKNIPETEESRIQIDLSRTKLQATMFEIIDDGVFPGIFSNEMFIVGATELYEYLEKLEPLLRQTSSVRKSRILKELKVRKERITKGMVYIFPSLADTRRAWEYRFGKTKWSNNIAEWQVKKLEI